MSLLKPAISTVIFSPFSYLHSTMSLLKHENQKFKIISIEGFTFHYVTIKTHVANLIWQALKAFTFHYVTIKTESNYNTVTHL